MGAIGLGYSAGPPVGSLLAVVRCTTKLPIVLVAVYHFSHYRLLDTVPHSG